MTDRAIGVRLPPGRVLEPWRPGAFAPMAMSRPIAVPRRAVYVLMFGLYLTVRGYHSLDGDQAYRLPLLLHRQDPSRFADDPFVRAFDAFNPHGGYLALLDLASRPMGLSAGLFGLFAATFAMTGLGVSRLARAVWPEAGTGVGMVAFGLVLLAKAGNVGTNHLFEAMLLDRLIGFALGWSAMALAIEGEWWRPALLIGLATVVHPSVGLQLAGLLGAAWVAWAVASRWTGQGWRTSALGVAALALGCLPGALPTLVQGRRLFEGMPPEEFRLLGVELQMAQHMVPSLWRTPQWLAWGAYLVVGGLALFRSGTGGAGRSPVGWASPTIFEAGRRPEEGGRCPPDESERVEPPSRPTSQVRFAILAGVLLAGLGVAYLMVEVVGNLRITVFQPFRMATIARGLALVALSGRCVGLWRRGDFAGRVRVLVLAAGLSGDWAFVAAVAFELAASLGEAIRRHRAGTSSRTISGGFDRGWSAWRTLREVGMRSGPAWVVLGYGLVFLSRHDTERGQWPILVAIVAAAGVGLVGRRVRRGWTRRRLGFAVAACWALPTAAMIVPQVAGPDDRLARGLATRCRFGFAPADDVERLALWSRERTPAGARFITPPGPKTFRLWSGRAVAFNRAASPYHAEGLRDWSGRFRAHVGFSGTTAEFVRAYLGDRHGVEGRYARLSPDELAALAASQGADHVLAAAPSADDDGRGPLRLLKVEGRYAVYRVDDPRSPVAVPVGSATRTIFGRWPGRRMVRVADPTGSPGRRVPPAVTATSAGAGP